MGIYTYICLIITIHYFVLGVTITGKKGGKRIQILAQNVIVHIGIAQEREFQKVLF